MMAELEAIRASNARYASEFGDGELSARPARAVAVITCMDARMHPEQFLGFGAGDAHVIRNAGGRASDDAIRSLIISASVLGTREVLVIHHTDCGLLTNNTVLREQVQRASGMDARAMDFLPFSDLTQSVRDDVERVLASPFLPAGTTVSGHVYEVESGRLREVVPSRST